VARRHALLKSVAVALGSLLLAGCSSPLSEVVHADPLSPPRSPTGLPTQLPGETSQETKGTLSSRYGFPSQIDPTHRYMVYLHGKIVEDQGLPATNPEFGEYQYEAILESLESQGFVVISELRPKNADQWVYARRGATQVGQLLAAGVPPGSISVVGASKGASIAAGVSHLVGDPSVNYVLLGTCHPSLIEQWKQQGLTLSGNVLAIRDVADDEYSGSCDEIFTLSQGEGLGHYDELVLRVGAGHGILYQPLLEWIRPTVQWANQQR
jgi:hypothetical protein